MPMRRAPLIPSLAAVLVMAAAGARMAGAQSGGPFALTGAVHSGGGGLSTAGPFALGGTVGQPEAGRHSGGAFELTGGFWRPGGSGTVSAPAASALPTRVALASAAPNPFRGASTLGFELPRETRVRLEVFGIDGRRVRSLVSGVVGAGRHRALWNGRDDHGLRLRPGLYLVRFEADGVRHSRRLTLLD